jgi:hypothetical protein
MTYCNNCKINTISLKRMVDFDVCLNCGVDKPQNEYKNLRSDKHGNINKD